MTATRVQSNMVLKWMVLMVLMVHGVIGAPSTQVDEVHDLISRFKQTVSYQGVLRETDRETNETIWRVRPKMPPLSKTILSLGRLRSQTSDGFSLFVVGRQVPTSSGTLLTFSSGQTVLLSVTSLSQSRQLKVRYMDTEGAVQIAIFRTPFVNNELVKVLLVMEPTRMSLFTGCDDVQELTLEEEANFDLPENTILHVLQTAKAKNKFNGWIQTLELHTSVLQGPPWDCAPAVEEQGVIAEGGDVQNDEPVSRNFQHSRASSSGGSGGSGGVSSGSSSRSSTVFSSSQRVSGGSTRVSSSTQSQTSGSVCETETYLLENSVLELTRMLDAAKEENADLQSQLRLLETCECKVQACIYNGKVYENNQQWYADPCTVCQCQEGSTLCSMLNVAECNEPCALSPCLNGGTCLGNPGYQNFTCLCPPSCSGSRCQHMINVCAIGSEYGECSDRLLRYYYDHFLQRCVEFVYSGCGGNGNNFLSYQACQDQCLVGSCCYRTYQRITEGDDFLAFASLTPGHKCQELSLAECRLQGTINPASQQRKEVTAFHAGLSCEEVECGASETCTVDGIVHQEGDVLQKGCQTCICVRGGRVECRCTNVAVRKEIRDMTREELDRFQEAVRILRGTGPGNSWESLRNLYITHVMEAHSRPLFLLWHRIYLTEVEKKLQEIDCLVTIPYFDFTLDTYDLSRSVVWQPNYFGGNGDVDADGCVPDHPFRNDTAWKPCLVRSFQLNHRLPSKLDIALAVASESYSSFSECLQMILGQVYSYVGGHIATSAAPYDPLFLPIQAYADMLFWQWQKISGNQNSFPSFLLDVPMVPFNVEPRDVLQLEHSVCVTYLLPSLGAPCNYTAEEFNNFGFDVEGYDRNGFNRQGFDRFGYNAMGFNRYGQRDTRDIYIYNTYSFQGYNRSGYDRRGYNRYGYSVDGYNRDGYDVNGYDRLGLNRYGLNRDGFDARGYSIRGYNQDNRYDQSDYYDSSGFDSQCLDRQQLDISGFDRFGFNLQGSRVDYCTYGFNGPHELRISLQVDAVLFGQSKDFLMAYFRTCSAPSREPIRWYEQTWTDRTKPFFRLQVASTQFPHSVYSQRFCLDIEPLLTRCPCQGEPAICTRNPCKRTCGSYPDAVCFVNFCDGCYAQWYLNGEQVNCDASVRECSDGFNRYREDAVWRPDPCTTCRCSDGSVDCEVVRCPRSACSHPALAAGDCCATCDGCQYGTYTYANGQTFNAANEPCSECTCINGNVECRTVTCPPVTCDYPWTYGDRCCPSCDGCVYDGRVLRNGQAFSYDTCTMCRCEDGDVSCDQIECGRLSCDNQINPEGSCCPRCRDGCEYEGMSFNNGMFFTPMSNPCLQCSCRESIVRCHPLPCDPPECDNPIYLLGACCPVCTNKCVHDGKQYDSGDVWLTSDQCDECYCRGSEVSCRRSRSCPDSCEHGLVEEGQCCSSCTDCLYNGQAWSNFAEFPNQDGCSYCSCYYGTVTCRRKPCVAPSCANPVLLPGECCPSCKECEDRFGNTYGHGETWIPRSGGRCEECVCRDSQIICGRQECTQQCTHPRYEENGCCPLCDGCFFQGREYDDSAPVYTQDACETCVCRDGSVLCAAVECPVPPCRNPMRVPGECCPQCPRFETDTCEYEGQRYINGEEFVPQSDACLRCTCRSGRLDCQSIESQCNTQCTHPVRDAGECCSSCRDCDFDGRVVPNGANFMDPSDECNLCTCSFGSIFCDVQECPEVTCRNPVRQRGECCPQCPQCLFEGREYEDNSPVRSRDPCETCQCRDGRVECDLVDCPPLRCRNPIIRTGECCPVCLTETCDYEGRTYQNDAEFMSISDPCLRCLCRAGEVTCLSDAVTCITQCSHPVSLPEQCCPECYDCYFLERTIPNGANFADPDNECQTCTCQYGSVTCQQRECPRTTCSNPVPVPGECCPQCLQCEYDGREYENDAPVFSSDPCETCVCRQGEVICARANCPRPLCPNPVEVPGRCCPECPSGCEYEGQRYSDGDDFISERDPCLSCVCRSGRVDCVSQLSRCVTSCSHPVQPPDECCPVCLDCSYLRRAIRNGARFSNPDDECQICTCAFGSVTCEVEECPSVSCRNPRRVPGECCPQCSVCVDNGQEYAEGETWTSTSQSCTTCACVDGRTTCEAIPCATNLPCTHPARSAEGCCNECDNCFYDRRYFLNGQRSMDPLDPCRICVCQDGNMQCEPRECPELTCSDQYRPDGECCTRCAKCEFEGQEFLDGARFPSPTDSCFVCECYGGRIGCGMTVECPPVTCSHPRTVDCCPVCSGCEYNGYELGNREELTISEECVICSCLNGVVNCIEDPDCDASSSYDDGSCDFNGELYYDGQQFTNPLDPCVTCNCALGIVQCQEKPCPSVSCIHPRLEGCCLVCDSGCTYLNQTYAEEEAFQKPDDACQMCTCSSGSLICNVEVCPELPESCDVVFERNGECCPSCQSGQTENCYNNGIRYNNGEIFKNFTSCQQCQCLDTINCETIPCDPAPCTHPVTRQCCPSCIGCHYHGENWISGADFADPRDDCGICHCENGNVFCQKVPCPSLNCPHQTQLENTCCPTCIDVDCVYDGTTHGHGTIFPHAEDECQECSCNDGDVYCQRNPCTQPQCPYPIRGTCCDTCDGCYFTGVEYSSGEIFEDPTTPCQECECQAGFVNCVELECLEPPCGYPVKLSGECCATCQGCYFGGRSYRNGETFSNPENSCQMCDCQFGNVTCEKGRCPFTSCEYPTEDECGCPICDGCTYRGVEYRDGMSFHDPQNTCRECSCLKGYINCQPIQCPQAPCFHPALQPGQCCETCDSCQYEGQTYQNRQEFADSIDSCRVCTCTDGNVNCGLKVCGRASCLHPMMDECNCPVCDGCMYEDVMVMSEETFVDPNNECRDCACERGSVSCFERGCPPANCTTPTNVPGECCPVCLEPECLEEPDPCANCLCQDGEWVCETPPCPEVVCLHPGQGMCCPECDGCTYGGKPWANQDSFPDPSDGCGICTCLNGFVTCEEPVCAPVDCPNPTIPAGTCCPVCVGQCTVDGVKYNNGEDFIPPGDSCQRCTCRNGQAFCSAVECSRLCGHPRTIPGQCCPVCDGCSFEGVEYNNAVQFISPVNNCHSCTCYNGNVECEVIQCPELSCPSPVDVPGECCQTCQECNYQGRTYIDGSTFPASAPCRECTCQGTRVRCNAITCENSDCTHPVPGACCPLCDACLFEENMYNNGQTFNPDNCRLCNCLNGNVLCTSQECPELTCVNRVRDPGQCCDRCQGCIYEGFEYNSGETWVSALNLCLTCQCQDGVTMCTEVRCLTPDFCTNPVNVPGQCCPICPGCAYNGITYQNGQSFHPHEDPCETCICEHGSLTCVRESCPALNDCPPNAIQPPALGECCGTCSGDEEQRVCDAAAIGGTFKPYSDPCFTCHCTNSSTWECMQDMCPMLMCPRSERFRQKDECCPKCQRCVEEDSRVSHLTGQTWRKPDNPCIVCGCDFGAINCQLESCPPVQCEEGFEAVVPDGLCCPECRNVRIPCYYQGVQYVNGESWARDECTRCECLEGEVQCETSRCQALFCESDEVPTLDPGNCCPRCVPRPATCIAFGDPHYRTFDGKLIHFQGTCRYIMSMDCDNQDFIVEVKNSNRGVGGSVSWTEEVSVIVDGVQVDLGQSGLVKVDREVIVPPYLKGSVINVERRGDGYYVNTNVGVKVTWDGSSYVEVSIPGSYARRTCGLCGNFNGYPQDDLQTRSGQIISSVAMFGNSWKVPGSDSQDCDADDVDPCDSAGFYVRNLANIKCSAIKSARFARCHGLVPPEPYYAACVYDLCACTTSDTCLCDAVGAYAAECRNEGIFIDWRDGTLCPIECPTERGFLFDECGPACPRTCINKDIPFGLIDEQCLRPCVPGCQCPAHKVLHSGFCIDSENCPADYKVNATIVDVGRGRN